MAKTLCGVAWECATGRCRKGLEGPRSTTMSVNATAVGRVAIMGATGVGGLDGGYVVLEWVKAQTHDKLVPQQQLSVVVSRPELADYGLKLLSASAQMEHARGATQAQQVSAATTPNWSRDGDVHIAAVLQDASSRAANAEEPSLLWHLQGECAKLAAGGDWDGVSVLCGAIVALAKGKGKGKGKGTAVNWHGKNELIHVYFENNIFNVYLNREVKSTETNVNDADHYLAKKLSAVGRRGWQSSAPVSPTRCSTNW